MSVMHAALRLKFSANRQRSSERTLCTVKKKTTTNFNPNNSAAVLHVEKFQGEMNQTSQVEVGSKDISWGGDRAAFIRQRARMEFPTDRRASHHPVPVLANDVMSQSAEYPGIWMWANRSVELKKTTVDILWTFSFLLLFLSYLHQRLTSARPFKLNVCLIWVPSGHHVSFPSAGFGPASHLCNATIWGPWGWERKLQANLQFPCMWILTHSHHLKWAYFCCRPGRDVTGQHPRGDASPSDAGQ